jgi:hypothetical protein
LGPEYFGKSVLDGEADRIIVENLKKSGFILGFLKEKIDTLEYKNLRTGEITLVRSLPQLYCQIRDFDFKSYQDEYREKVKEIGGDI